MQTVWPGLAVEDANLTVQIATLRRVLDRDRAQGSHIQTIPGRGYRFVATVSTGTAAAPSAEPDPTLPDKPSVAVLAFVNMSSDPEQEFFADGIAEDVITMMSRYPSLFVIARNSSFTYKARAIEVRQIGHELGVRYVLEGSLRKSGNRIRVNAQLIEAQTGNHVWAERYDRDLADIFAVQDEITEAVTVAIAPAIDQAELQRAIRKPPESLDAWAAYQRGLWHLEKATAKDCVLAEKFFHHAIALDPNFVGGYCGLSTAYLYSANVYLLRTAAEACQLAEPLARQALALDGANPEAHACLSFVLLRARR
jgi:adenylate cyclase